MKLCERIYKGVRCNKPAVCKGAVAWFCAECWDLLQRVIKEME